MHTEKGPNRNHPVIEAFSQQHEDCSPDKTQLAFHVYLNLAEVKGWRDVNLHYCEKLQMPFITGRSSLSAALEAAYPMAMEDSLSHQQIQILFSALRVGEQQFNSIMLAIVASDTSIVYYKVSNEIVQPEPPEVSDARKQQWFQKAAKRKHYVAECIENYSRSSSSDPP